MFIKLNINDHECSFLSPELIVFTIGDDQSSETPGVHPHKLRQRLVDRCDHLAEEVLIKHVEITIKPLHGLVNRLTNYMYCRNRVNSILFFLGRIRILVNAIFK